MVCGGVLQSTVTCLAKFLTSAHHIPVALPQVMTMDISKHCQVSPRNKTIVETYHSSADDQQRKKEEVGSICFEDIIFPGLVLGPVALMQGILGSVVPKWSNKVDGLVWVAYNHASAAPFLWGIG